MSLAITSRLGTVHAIRGGNTCPAATAATRRKCVTPLQIHVYKLAPCESCWPMRKSFEDLVEASAGRRQ